MANSSNWQLYWTRSHESRWKVVANDREPCDPTEQEIRRRINEVWRLKSANGGAYPEDARKVRCRAQCRVLRAIIDALPADGSEVRRSSLLRTLGIGELTMKRAVGMLSEAGIVETGCVPGQIFRWYRLSANWPVTDAELESIVWQSIRGRQEVAA